MTDFALPAAIETEVTLFGPAWGTEKNNEFEVSLGTAEMTLPIYANARHPNLRLGRWAETQGAWVEFEWSDSISYDSTEGLRLVRTSIPEDVYGRWRMTTPSGYSSFYFYIRHIKCMSNFSSSFFYRIVIAKYRGKVVLRLRLNFNVRNFSFYVRFFSFTI
jgi:hypothetical protein